MSRIDEYRKCAAAGMSKAETARALGVNRSTVGGASRRHGIEFIDKRGSAAGERLKALWKDPEFRAAQANAVRTAAKRLHAEGRLAMRHLRVLTPKERADYEVCRKNMLPKNEALTAIGRADLVEGTE